MYVRTTPAEGQAKEPRMTLDRPATVVVALAESVSGSVPTIWWIHECLIARCQSNLNIAIGRCGTTTKTRVVGLGGLVMYIPYLTPISAENSETLNSCQILQG